MNDDRMDPRFAGALRSALLEEVRATPRDERPAARVTALAPRRRGRLAVAGVLVAAAVAAIVFGAVTVARVSSAPQPASPSPVLDGGCGALLDDAAASDLTGATVTAAPPSSAIEDKKSLALQVEGGIRCAWRDADAVAGIGLAVVPDRVRTADSRDLACFSSGGREQQWTCRIDLTTGGRWITGFLDATPGTSKRQTLAAVARFDAIARALPAGQPADVPRTTGWWRAVDCEVLGERTDLGRVMGVRNPFFGGANGGMEPDGVMAAMADTGTTWCAMTYGGDDDQMMVDVWGYPGAAEVARPIVEAKGVQRLGDVDRAAVYRVGKGQSPVLWVVDGPNVLLLQPQGLDDPATVTRLRAAIPVLLRDFDAHARR